MDSFPESSPQNQSAKGKEIVIVGNPVHDGIPARQGSEEGSSPQNESAKGKEIAIVDPDVCNPVDDDFDWDTDDELEMQFIESALDDQGTPCEKDSPAYCLEAASSGSSSSYRPSKVDHFVSMGFAEKLVVQAIKENGEDNDDAILNSLLTYSVSHDEAASSCSSSSYRPSKVDHFVSMGFAEKLVVQAIKENGEDNDDVILNSLLTYSVLKDPPEDNLCSSKLDEDFSDDLSDCDSGPCEAAIPTKESGRESNNNYKSDMTISMMVDMGYQVEDVVTAIERCGHDASIEQLADFISAAEVAKIADAIDFREPIQTVQSRIDKIRKASQELNARPRKRPQRREESCSGKPMIGFGVPECVLPPAASYRIVPDDAAGPPYFYFENVALTPKGVWEQISQFLYDIEPEFVDSIHFSAAARKRGYIHNLPIKNRQPLLPIPPKTIHEAIPDTKKWWPSWDKRTKLNCLLTCFGSAQLTERIRKKVQSGEPSEIDKKWVINQCKKWNLVWVGKNRVAVLEPEDMEMLLGFPRYHTRGVSRTDRYKVLGNSFQIDTVAYHLSVLKPMYPNGMNVLSLFSGIGGAEVALHKLGITLKNVVSVEISPVSRKVMQDWWEETGLEGRLIHVNDVQKVNSQMIDQWIEEFGGFDLVIGGSPCNNLSGGNRRTRDGLEGEHSSLFFQYYRILDYVRSSMKIRAAF